MQPNHLFHADWGIAPQKRWLARAELGPDGRYFASGPNRIENHIDLIPSISKQIGDTECVLIGFDFPIGIPAAYAERVGVTNFKSFLKVLGNEQWVDFYTVAREPSEITPYRPFYPFAPGKTRQAHLLEALGLSGIDELRRQCEKQQIGRRAACPLFWTLGANQVGKGAMVGWRDVIAPALRENESILLWPFDGCLNNLILPGKIVIGETYPAECYRWFLPGPLNGKGNQEVRRSAGRHLQRWTEAASVELDPELARRMEEGFPEGDDAFDAVVGLFGMMEVATGRRQSGEPSVDGVRTLEGWIFGQSAT
jgi:hypothetical protein